MSTASPWRMRVPTPVRIEPGWYRDYLNSDHWQSLRRKVLDRAAGRCEGCRNAPPTEVHHITYAHVQREFLFELVALCENCHRRIHKDP